MGLKSVVPGAVDGHPSPGTKGRKASRHYPTAISVTVQGAVTIYHSGHRGSPPSVGGRRGEVVGLSAAAQRRLVARLLSISEDAIRSGYFVTLTYPDSCLPSTWQAAKRQLDSWAKRLLYHYPMSWGFWVNEWVDRKSGMYVGRSVPHYHLLVGGLPDDVATVRAFCITSWGEVIGALSAPDAPDFVVHGVHVVKPYGRLRDIGWYIAKYVSKAAGSSAAGRGRVWGIVGRDNVPFAPAVSCRLPAAAAVHFKRLVRSWLRWRGNGGHYALTVYGLPSGLCRCMVAHACDLAGVPAPLWADAATGEVLGGGGLSRAAEQPRSGRDP